MIQRARQQHFTYPVLHYFHSGDEASAVAPNLVNLDDALLLLNSGVAAEVRPGPGALRPLVNSIGGFLDTVGTAYTGPAAIPTRRRHSSRSETRGYRWCRKTST